MLQLDVLLTLLDQLRAEAIDAAERPDSEHKSEFGFGRVSGMLQAIREIRERVEGVVQEANPLEKDETEDEEQEN